MRIAYDAKRAFQNNTGLGNYSRSLIAAMTQYYPDNEYLLYTPRRKYLPQSKFLLQLSNIRIKYPRFLLFSSYWRSKGILRDLLRDNIDLYHGLSHEIPIGIQHTRIRTVVTIHDLIYLRYPQYYPSLDRKIYEAKTRNACIYANHIIAISEQTKRDIMDFIGIDADKISVVYQGCNPVFYIPATEEQKSNITAKYQLPEKYILCVGTIEERKNLMVVVKSLIQLPDNLKLVVVGKPTNYTDEIKKYISDNELQSRVLFLDKVHQQELPVLYQMAQVFVYPSRFEGFGIPVIEALNSGVPVIAAKGSSLEEAGGIHSMYINPDDENELAASIAKIENNDTLKKQMIDNGKTYAQEFRENVMVEKIMNVYKNVF